MFRGLPLAFPRFGPFCFGVLAIKLYWVFTLKTFTAHSFTVRILFPSGNFLFRPASLFGRFNRWVAHLSPLCHGDSGVVFPISPYVCRHTVLHPGFGCFFRVCGANALQREYYESGLYNAWARRIREAFAPCFRRPEPVFTPTGIVRLPTPPASYTKRARFLYRRSAPNLHSCWYGDR